MDEQVKSKMGRPKEDIYEKYVAGKEESVIMWCRNGADNEVLSKKLGCGKTTLSKMIKNYPEFKKLIKEGKEEADFKVEAALYKRALGYEFEEVTTEVSLNKDGSGTTTVIKKTKKFIAPDTTAGIFWLKNRKSEEWRDRQEVNMSVSPFEQMMQAATSDDGNK
jgi:hypothetical protein